MAKRKHDEVRNPYNYDFEKLSDDTGLLCTDETRCQQQFVEESDINYITDKFMKTGELPQLLNMPTYGDFNGIFDFQSAMNTIAQAREQFMSLPAKTRSRFSNDPAELIAFLEDDDNYKEAVKLGFIAPRDDTGDNNGPQTASRTRPTPQTGKGDRGTNGNQESSTRPQAPGSQAPQDDRGGAGGAE